jgi:hypothetical protein
MDKAPQDTTAGASRRPALPEERRALLDLHIAEYNAITTRGTSFLNLQATLWPMLVFSLTLIGIAGPHFPPPLVAWGSCLVVDMSMYGMLGFFHEHYLGIQYIEGELRDAIKDLVDDGNVWQYETWLGKQHDGSSFSQRALTFFGKWELATLFFPVAALAVAGVMRWPTWGRWDRLGSTVALAAVVFLFFIARATAATRHSMLGRLNESGQPPPGTNVRDA